MLAVFRTRKCALFVGTFLSLFIKAETTPNPILPIGLPLPTIDPYPNTPFLKTISSIGIPPSNQTISNSSSTTRNSFQPRDVIGTDDREFWTSANFPYNAMGRLESIILTSTGQPTSISLCSATLIGPRHVATAAHCIQKPANTLSKVRFQPGYDECESTSGGSFATYIYSTAFSLNDSGCASYTDVAILVLEHRLGDKLGFLDVGAVELGDVNKAIFNSFGYPIDKGDGERPVRQRGISVTSPPGLCGVGNPVITNADVGLGMSGGPLWRVTEKGFVMVAVLSTSLVGKNLRASAFSGGGVLVDYVERMRIEYPLIKVPLSNERGLQI